MTAERPADSAGTPWRARELTPSGFETDTGAADPALLAVLAESGDDTALMAAVSGSRLLVPVVAEPAEVDRTGDLAVDHGVDMAVVTLVAPDGRRALPVFSGAEALAAWDPQARPVPVTPARAAQAAVSEGCDVLVVDVAGPASRVLRSSMLWALALERDLGAAAHRPVRRPRRRGRGAPPSPRSSSTPSRRARRRGRASSRWSSRCGPGWTPSRSGRSPPGSANASPRTVSCGPASTASRSASSEDFGGGAPDC